MSRCWLGWLGCNIEGAGRGSEVGMMLQTYRLVQRRQGGNCGDVMAGGKGEGQSYLLPLCLQLTGQASGMSGVQLVS